jgi:hypothetical protein
LLWVWPLFLASVGVVLLQAATSSAKNVSLHAADKQNKKYKLLITFLHVIQPVARLYGRLKHGLTPWRLRGNFFEAPYIFVFRSKIFSGWSEEWRATEDWLTDLERQLINMKTRVKRGGDFNIWDIEVRNSIFSFSRGLFTVEEHGAGKQLLRFKAWPAPSKTLLFALLGLSGLAFMAALDNAQVVAAIITGFIILFLAAYAKDTASTIASLQQAFNKMHNTFALDTAVNGADKQTGFHPLPVAEEQAEKLTEQTLQLEPASQRNSAA